jgi:peptidoglycan/xylan/chitin deacetylase (PgdA/CDA1 family)
MGKIAISFDDAPTADTSSFSGAQRTDMICSALEAKNVQATFYVNSKNLRNDVEEERIRQYDKSGHFIANHGHGHLDAKKISFDRFVLDFLAADKLLRNFQNFRSWYRFPYLKLPENIEQVVEFLQEQKYQLGSLSVLTQDWRLQQMIDNRDVDQARLGQLYIEMITQQISFYTHLGRKDMPHILLLHENDLAALYLPRLLDEIKNLGFTIISMEEALVDKFYQLPLEEIMDFVMQRSPWMSKDGEQIQLELEKRQILR